MNIIIKKLLLLILTAKSSFAGSHSFNEEYFASLLAKEDYTRIHNEIEPWVQAENSKALNIKGTLLGRGWGADLDIGKAEELLKLSISKGSVKAKYNLARVYIFNGVSKHYTLARTLMTDAANAGDADAMYNLSLMLEEGLGGEIDLKLSFKWLERAAQENVLWAQYNLGNRFIYGIGVKASCNDAKYWWEIAAKEDMPEASMNLGYVWETGCWGEFDPDLQKAQSHYLDAAKGGYGAAYLELASIFNGAGNYAEALNFLQKGILGTISYNNPSFYSEMDHQDLQDVSDYANAFFVKGRIEMNLQDFKGCVASFEKSAKIEGSILNRREEYAVASTNAAICALQAGMNEYATDKFDNAIKIFADSFGLESPQYIEANLYKALAGKNLEVSALNIEHFLDLFKDCCAEENYKVFEFRTALGKIYHQLGALELARDNFVIAKEIFETNRYGDSFEFYVTYAAFLLEMNAISDAAYYVEAAKELFYTYNSELVSLAKTQKFGEPSKLVSLIFELSLQNSSASNEQRFKVIQYAQPKSVDIEFNIATSKTFSKDEVLKKLLQKVAYKSNEVNLLRSNLDKLLINSVANSLKKREIVRKISVLDNELDTLEHTILNEFPRYSELVNPQPLTLSDTWDLLGLNEGLFTFVSDEETEATYAFMVTKDDARAYKVDLSEAQIAEIVSTLRAGIDLSNSFGIGDLPNFDMNLSYDLYSSLFGPAEDMLDGVEHLLVVPTGPLESLPLNVLVTEKPEIDPAASVFDNYQAAAWLPKSYSLTRLPSVSSLRALRVFAAAGEAKEPFIGFGDPILNGDAGDLRGLELASVYRGTTADIDQVRNLPELPDTADELKRIAQYLRAPDDKIYLRERATETVLKNTDLTNSRVVAFATHGLVGGEISGLAEPALVLSPPDEATEEDDGLLKASEVAQLKMNADIIMLSACNTASGDELGAEGLSGLARAFIYAGARSLLVSHWSVESTSAAELTTGMFDAMSADKSIGRSEALQMSMVDLMTDKERSYYSHPAFWAPFSLVGDGATLN